MNSHFITISQYIESKQSIADKIVAYDTIISGMESAILRATESGEYAEYEMDDGQMKVRAKYRSASDMARALDTILKLRQRYVTKYNGSCVVLRGGNL
jgi:hypothetical protein